MTVGSFGGQQARQLQDHSCQQQIAYQFWLLVEFQYHMCGVLSALAVLIAATALNCTTGHIGVLSALAVLIARQDISTITDP